MHTLLCGVAAQTELQQAYIFFPHVKASFAKDSCACGLLEKGKQNSSREEGSKGGKKKVCQEASVLGIALIPYMIFHLSTGNSRGVNTAKDSS